MPFHPFAPPACHRARKVATLAFSRIARAFTVHSEVRRRRPITGCALFLLRLGRPATVKYFKEQVPSWLSLKEKYRRIAVVTAGRTIR